MELKKKIERKTNKKSLLDEIVKLRWSFLFSDCKFLSSGCERTQPGRQPVPSWRGTMRTIFPSSHFLFKETLSKCSPRLLLHRYDCGLRECLSNGFFLKRISKSVLGNKHILTYSCGPCVCVCLHARWWQEVANTQRPWLRAILFVARTLQV